MKNELRRIASKYFSNEINDVHHFGEEKFLLHIMNLLSNAEAHERPDAYSNTDNEVLILEHFEFDSSEQRKGSQQQYIEAECDRKLYEIKEPKNITTWQTPIEGNYSIANYKKNATKQFLKHYNKINNYKQILSAKGIITENKKVITMFFIEDTTELGNYYRTGIRGRPVASIFLPSCDFFLDLFENSPDLDCAICACYSENKYILNFINHASVNRYRKEQIITEQIEYISLIPQRIDYVAPLKDIEHPEEISYKE